MEIICFHNPDEENGYLSNWFHSDFSIDEIEFSSMEQYMMYKKAVCFSDKKIAEEILSINDNIWNGKRQIIVYEGLLAKFSQNYSLKKMLKNTGDAMLAECAVRDKIWGIGLSMSDPKRLNIDEWRGQNLLGYALMQVREKV